MNEDKRKEYEAFQNWCLRNYGEGTKSKTIRLHKYKKILSSLRGEMTRSADSSKFRFWVKTKGFRLVDCVLYVPASSGGPLRRVAVVEDFYDIIYGVHVMQGARSGIHAGQKRTYRAVSERFAFLPREAVTKFLLGCSDCQKRIEPDGFTPKRSRSDEYMPINLTTRSCVIQLSVPCAEIRSSTPNRESSEEDIDISPISTDEELIRVPEPSKLDSWGLGSNGNSRALQHPNIEINGQTVKSEIRVSPDPENEEFLQGRNGEGKEEAEDWCYGVGKKPETPQSRDLSASPMTLQETSSLHDETSSSGNKDEDEDEEDDVDDLKAIPHDPERLKAFNMFVRLFVDENLDRIVPISKQPKEKIQAIIDSCTRQFPEFAERARKRIRTYLKSCRRNKRSRETSFESNRPTPAHLTSAQAEQILASACENEAHNAKRMRLGLEPVSQPLPVLPGTETRQLATDHFSPANLSAETKQFANPQVNNNNKTDSVNNLARAMDVKNMNPTLSSLYRPLPEGPGRPSPEPTDLSLRPRLSAHELNSVRRLITGYRESAAFLLRSADELEQLLLHQS